jgi:ABC-type Zn2+ transport system substrate-binding protein/surface adhesin
MTYSTYDQWKTTDPREFMNDEEDHPSEADILEKHLWQVKEDAKDAALKAEKRITELEAALNECLEYFQDHSDVDDGDYGEPYPNKEMRLASMVDEALHGIQF